MNVFHRYTRRSLRRNRTRTVVTLIGIILSMAMFTAVIEAANSGLQFLVRAETYRTGSFHAYYHGLTEDEAALAEAAERVTASARWQEVGWADVGSTIDSKPYLVIQSAGENLSDLVAVHIVSGRMPENDHEILLPSHLRFNEAVSAEVGDTLTLMVGQRVGEHMALNFKTAYEDDGAEQIVNAVEKSYSVVGYYDRFDYCIEQYDCPGYIALTVGEASGSISVFFTIRHPMSFYAYMQENAVSRNWVDHSDILIASGAVRNDTIVRVLYSMVVILVALISFGSISLIYNSFSISVSERTKQFGILKSIGATRKQIRGAVLYEAMLLCVIAIPLGMLVGCLGIGITLFCLRDAFGYLMGTSGAVQMYLVISPWGLVAAAVICLLTTLISAWIPARRALRVPAIDAIRQTGDVRLRSRDVRVFPLTKKLFGFEGMLAAKNFGRNRRRYRATVISLFLSVTLFISASSFCAYMTDAVVGITSSSGTDSADIVLRMYREDERAEELFARLSAVEGVRQKTLYRSVTVDLAIDQEDISGTYRFNDYLTLMSGGAYSLISGVLFLDDDAFRAFCAENRIDSARFFVEGSPVALACNRVTGSFTTSDGGSKWAESDVLKPDCVPTAVSIVAVKSIDGYTQAECSRDPAGDIYYYYPTDYFIEWNGSVPLDRSRALAVPAEEALMRTTLTVAAVSENRPALDLGSGSSAFVLLYPMAVQEEVCRAPGMQEIPINTTLAFSVKDHKAAYAEMAGILSECGYMDGNLTDHAADYEAMRMMVVCVNVFSYGFIILISLIAMANVFNTISTSISLRRREFAMLKSVGMTNRGFHRMMNFECLRYGIKGLMYGLPAAMAVTYVIYQATYDAYERSFYVPWYSIVIAVGSVFAVVFATMIYTTRKIKHDNPIDALKNENL